MEELFELHKVSPKYWGKDTQISATIALLELVGNDYPEKCLTMGSLRKETTQSDLAVLACMTRPLLHHLQVASFGGWKSFLMIQLMFHLNHVNCAWMGGSVLNMEINI